MDCGEGSRYYEAANETLPGLLQAAEGTLRWAQYREQVRSRNILTAARVALLR